MKKKLRLLFLSHLHDRLGLVMRFSLLMGLLATITLSVSASSYGADGKSGSNDGMTPQQLKVTGTIKDVATGEVLPGVNVVVDGTSIGVMTGIDGKFALAIPNANSSLKVSFIGYVAQTIPVNGKSVIDVALAPDIKALEDVVVVGYGTVRKTD